MSEYHILIISPEPWNHIFVSKHHYATHLAKMGYSVYFLNPPSRSWKKQTDKSHNVMIIDYTGFPSGLRFYPTLFRELVTKKVFDKIENFISSKIDILWNFDSSVFYSAKLISSETKKIFHRVDLNQNFNDSIAGKNSDLCVASSSVIYEEMSKYSNSLIQINHGVNTEQKKLSHNIPGANSNKAIYAGNLSLKYIDWNAIYNCIIQNETVDFIFIGPNHDNFDLDNNPTEEFKEKSYNLPNTFWVNPIESSCLQSFYKEASVLFLAYRDQFYKQVSNPHKMMEYLLSGKPILATYTIEYKHIQDIIYMTKTNNEFGSAMKDLFKNYSYWNSPYLIEKRKSLAFENTYEKQIQRIFNELKLS